MSVITIAPLGGNQDQYAKEIQAELIAHHSPKTDFAYRWRVQMRKARVLQITLWVWKGCGNATHFTISLNATPDMQQRNAWLAHHASRMMHSAEVELAELAKGCLR